MIGRNITNSRILALACIIFVLLVLAACGSGGGGQATIHEPVGDGCGLTSIPIEHGQCHWPVGGQHAPAFVVLQRSLLWQ